jgi:hypothetical protein
MARYDVQGGYVEVPDTPPPNGGGSMESYQWAWNMNYNDPKKYTGRVVNAGWHGALGLAKTKFPPGYKIPNGQPGGGFPASGAVPTGNEPIRLCPPIKGTGRIMFVTNLTMTVVNNSSQEGRMTYGLGVTYVNGPNKPMYPYLGVCHGLETLDDSAKLDEFPPNSTKIVHCSIRMDLMDNAFQSDQPIPGWPNWELVLSTDGKEMYPAVSPTVNNSGSVPLTVMDIFGFGYVC